MTYEMIERLIDTSEPFGSRLADSHIHHADTIEELKEIAEGIKNRSIKPNVWGERMGHLFPLKWGEYEYAICATCSAPHPTIPILEGAYYRAFTIMKAQVEYKESPPTNSFQGLKYRLIKKDV